MIENLYLDAGDHERFERQYAGTEREAQALRGGEAAAQGLVYSAFSRDTHVLPHAEARDRVVDDWRAYGYDAGWNDPRVVLELGRTPLDQLVGLDAFDEGERHIDDVRAWLAAGDRPAGRVYCAHDPAHVDNLRRAGYDAEVATKDLDDGIAEVRKRLEADGNQRVTQPTGKRTVREPFVGFPRASSARTRRSRSRARQTETDDSPEESPTADELLVSERYQPLNREFLGDTEAHVGNPVAQEHALDALRDACMGVAGR